MNDYIIIDVSTNEVIAWIRGTKEQAELDYYTFIKTFPFPGSALTQYGLYSLNWELQSETKVLNKLLEEKIIKTEDI